MKLSGVMIGSDNPKRLGEFYTEVLGKPGFQDGDWYGWMDKANMMIGSHSDVNGTNKEPARIMLTLEVEDVSAEFEHLIKLGAKEVAKPYQPQPDQDMWLATVSDPDGNYIQVAMPWS